jgi:hypothetical protein
MLSLFKSLLITVSRITNRRFSLVAGPVLTAASPGLQTHQILQNQSSKSVARRPMRWRRSVSKLWVTELSVMDTSRRSSPLRRSLRNLYLQRQTFREQLSSGNGGASLARKISLAIFEALSQHINPGCISTARHLVSDDLSGMAGVFPVFFEFGERAPLSNSLERNITTARNSNEITAIKAANYLFYMTFHGQSTTAYLVIFRSHNWVPIQSL